MEVIQYNFSSFIDAFANMKKNCGATPDDLNTIKIELNKLFNDSDCREVLYTDNPDKMFFGIKVLPLIDADDIFDLLIEDEPYRVDKYILNLILIF